MAALRIGVNALYLIPGGVGGTEIYLRSLLSALGEVDSQNQYFVFTNRETELSIVPAAPNFHPAPQAVRAVFRPGRILWEQTALPLRARRLHLDVLLNPGFTAPALSPCPQVTVFHDLQHERHPEYFRWFDRPFWKILLLASARRSRRLIAVSEATRDDLAACYRLPPEKIALVPHGVDEVMFDIGTRREPKPFLLCVSTLHPHKNLDRLLRAFAMVRQRRPEFKLVLAGLKGFHASAVEAGVAGLGLTGAVRITGWLPRQELYELFRTAWAFVYPSTFEGFGLPVLEALAAGIPTACSDIRPLREVSGDAALRFDPSDETGMEEAIGRLMADESLRAELCSAGPRHARRYSWRTTAQRTLEVLEAAARG